MISCQLFFHGYKYCFVVDNECVEIIRVVVVEAVRIDKHKAAVDVFLMYYFRECVNQRCFTNYWCSSFISSQME